MALFGRNEEELKKAANELDQRLSELDKRDSSLKLSKSNLDHRGKLLELAENKLEEDREAFRNKTKQTHEAIAVESAELEKKRSELCIAEANAKAGFVEKQREAFKDVIEKRIIELDARQQEIEELESNVSSKLKDLHSKDGEIAKRLLAVTEREQMADAGFADKANALAQEASRQHQANQAEAERLRQLDKAINDQQQSLEKTKAVLAEREEAIIAAEQKRDAGFADQHNALNTKLRDKRAKFETEITEEREKKLSALENEIANLKLKRLDEVSKAELIERERIHAEINNDRMSWETQQEDARKRLEAERTELEKQKSAVSALRSELEGRNSELEANERLLERKEQRSERQWEKRNDNLEDEISDTLEEERKSLELEKQTFRNENTRLRDSIRIQTELVGAFDQLKQQLGGEDPAEILRDLNSKTDELKRLREALTTIPSEEERMRYKEMDSEAQRHRARIEELEEQINANATAVAEVADLRRKNSEFDAENISLQQKSTRFEASANEAQSELNRLRAAYERPAEVAARYKEIEMPHIEASKASQPKKVEIDEISWLKDLTTACDNYGLHFNPRILKAFHTALKTAEWSPITILAGVSGTGKSELPRLYSHFGGLMFEPLSVQPNWDSQESMLGFFNSIDNKFDAQPVLQFLAQTQKKWIEKTQDDEGYPGLQDSVNLVLLDEMNLAHPEEYFAEFLSKLELRRGRKGSDLPSLPVKIGAGLPPYQLRLGRNVLWTGTMNQDETTKSLSDKVLDRSIIIHFPRPTKLKRRLQLSPLDETNRGPLLHTACWQNWLAQGSSLSEEVIKPFKDFLEDINAALASTGRAIGHRVWQSVEYYMVNYPDVRAAQELNDKDKLNKALHIAFEDQLVQKVMPKLRGIDTRGDSKTKCLDKIRGQLNSGIGGNPFNLTEDFDLACQLGYGQFIWQSANYLNEVEGEIKVDSSSIECEIIEEADKNEEEPPQWFRPDDANRKVFWNKKSSKAREKLISNHENRSQ